MRRATPVVSAVLATVAIALTSARATFSGAPGADGTASTLGDNTVFATGGVFFP